MKKIVYEWDIEEVTSIESAEHEEGEVMEHNHQNSYADCMKFIERHPAPEGIRYEVCIVRDVLDENGSVLDRSWAYLKDGKLPEFFEDACFVQIAKVPKRFAQEIAKATPKRKIHKNIWGNWNGYISGRRAFEFGEDDVMAGHWLLTGVFDLCAGYASDETMAAAREAARNSY